MLSIAVLMLLALLIVGAITKLNDAVIELRALPAVNQNLEQQ